MIKMADWELVSLLSESRRHINAYLLRKVQETSDNVSCGLGLLGDCFWRFLQRALENFDFLLWLSRKFPLHIQKLPGPKGLEMDW